VLLLPPCKQMPVVCIPFAHDHGHGHTKDSMTASTITDDEPIIVYTEGAIFAAPL